MSYQASWSFSGTTIDDSKNALIKVSERVNDINTIKKYENQLNEKFQQHIQTHLRRSGLDSNSFDNTFFFKISNNHINFVNTQPLVTNRYEYGYYDSDNVEEDEAYIMETSPRYFIRPAIQDTLNDISHIITEEANKAYMENRRQTYGDEVYEK